MPAKTLFFLIPQTGKDGASGGKSVLAAESGPECQVKKSRGEGPPPDEPKPGCSVFAEVCGELVSLEDQDRSILVTWEHLFFEEIQNVWNSGAWPEYPRWFPIFPLLGLPEFSFTVGNEY